MHADDSTLARWRTLCPTTTIPAESGPNPKPAGLTRTCWTGKRRPVILICPGGGYHNRAKHEGHDVALWLNECGLRSCPALMSTPGMTQSSLPVRNEPFAPSAFMLTNGISMRIASASVAFPRGTLGCECRMSPQPMQTCANDPIDTMNCAVQLGILSYAVIDLESTATRAHAAGSWERIVIRSVNNTSAYTDKSVSTPCFRHRRRPSSACAKQPAIRPCMLCMGSHLSCMFFPRVRRPRISDNAS